MMRNRFMKRGSLVGTPIVAAMVMIAALAQPALAGTDPTNARSGSAVALAAASRALAANEASSCAVVIGQSYCETGTVSAGSAHVLHISVSKSKVYQYYLRVWDTTNGVTIYNVWHASETSIWLPNVWATYRAAIDCYPVCTGAVVWMANY
jgi:hypothetical protein